MKRIRRSLYKHPFFKDTRKYEREHPFIKFIIVFFIFISYFTFAIFKFGLHNGIIVSLLSWSFFVFCTPIADAGILLDFPVRLFTGIRMIFSEIFVWIIAFFLNLFTLIFNPNVYEHTILLKLFKQILLNPFPYYIIIILSCAGTFLSIYFGDEILDIISFKKRDRILYSKHNLKYKFIIFLFIIIFIIFLYYYLLHHMGINIPLF